MWLNVGPLFPNAENAENKIRVVVTDAIPVGKIFVVPNRQFEDILSATLTEVQSRLEISMDADLSKQERTPRWL